MNAFRRSFFPVTLYLCLLAVLSGCASMNGGNPASRKKERLAAYQSMPREFQDAIDQGALKAGMNQDAVYIVWGKPTQVLTGGSANGETLTWVYQGTYLQESRFWGRYRLYESYTPISYTSATVVFSNGVVREWQTYPHP